MDYFRMLAQMLQEQGRGNDTLLAHITPGEARLLKRRGGSGTVNPVTGLLEFDDGGGGGDGGGGDGGGGDGGGGDGGGGGGDGGGGGGGGGDGGAGGGGDGDGGDGGGDGGDGGGGGDDGGSGEGGGGGGDGGYYEPVAPVAPVAPAAPPRPVVSQAFLDMLARNRTIGVPSVSFGGGYAPQTVAPAAPLLPQGFAPVAPQPAPAPMAPQVFGVLQGGFLGGGTFGAPSAPAPAPQAAPMSPMASRGFAPLPSYDDFLRRFRGY